MEKLEYIVPCHFGLEAVLKRELTELGMEITCVEDGRVTFVGDRRALCRANVFLRSAQRVLLKVGSFRAQTFEELFQGTKALPWEAFVPKDGRFWVAKAASVKSSLFSPSDIQSVMKKAMVERMGRVHNIRWFSESGADYPVRVFLKKDEVTVGLDASGESLHKRGYRRLVAKAPIAENLAAALLMLTPWRDERILVDPFCGSGTIPIEAALMAARIAPGVNRGFQAESWPHLFPAALWEDVREEARSKENRSAQTQIQGYDIDGEVISVARENARLAGVEHLIHFQQKDVAQLSHAKKYGFLVTNPPYGERLEGEQDLQSLYRTLGERYRALEDWSMYVITAYEHAETALGRKADKNRKLYNGMIKTYFLQYMGKKPSGGRR